MTAQNKQEPITIHASEEGDRLIVLHPENNDLFVRTGKQVIAACRLEISLELWLTELGSMLESVRKWCEQRSSSVRACFCAPRGARTILFFVPVSTQFDFDLADELTALNTELVKQFNVGLVDVRQIPWDELDRFIDEESVKHIYGEQPRPRPAVEA